MPEPKTVTNLAGAMLTARTVKVTIPLDPHEVASLVVVEGQARTVLRLGLPATTIVADIASKALRRANHHHPRQPPRATATRSCKASSKARRWSRPGWSPK